jgi:hypothetical protein
LRKVRLLKGPNSRLRENENSANKYVPVNEYDMATLDVETKLGQKSQITTLRNRLREERRKVNDELSDENFSRMCTSVVLTRET